jgi:enoyl-CoA hydratase/carnithine racemase
MAELVIFEKHESIMLLRLNRPESRNALSSALLAEFGQHIERLKLDTSIRAVIITGAGDKAFCAGADLKERQGMSNEETLDFLRLIQTNLQNLAELPMPIIAAMNGDAFGGGLELALACDIRVAAQGAHMGLTECSLGIIPGAGGTQRLPRIVGVAKASELIFTAQKLTAHEALSIGLINYCAPSSEEAFLVAQRLAKTIASNAPLAVRAAKKALLSSQADIKDGLLEEFRAYQEILSSQDRQEGLKAFAQKRKPQFTGS